MQSDSFFGDTSDSDYSMGVRSERNDGGRHNRNAPPPPPVEISDVGLPVGPWGSFRSPQDAPAFAGQGDNTILWVIGGIAIVALLMANKA